MLSDEEADGVALPRMFRKESVSLTVMLRSCAIAQVRNYGKRQRLGNLRNHGEEITQQDARRQPAFFDCGIRNIAWESARRDSQIERHYPINKWMASLCEDCLERKV